MADPVIEREEIVALRFNVSEIVFQVTKIRELLEEDDGERKLTEAEQARAERERAFTHARRLRELAERAQAKLDAERSGG